jgi:hypothetical protein
VTGGVLSPESHDFSHDEGFDSEDDSDHYEDFSSDAGWFILISSPESCYFSVCILLCPVLLYVIEISTSFKDMYSYIGILCGATAICIFKIHKNKGGMKRLYMSELRVSSAAGYWSQRGYMHKHSLEMLMHTRALGVGWTLSMAFIKNADI